MTVILLEAALTARVGGGTVTVKASFWMTVRAPPVALTTMVVEPIAAEEEAARVNIEEPPSAVSPPSAVRGVFQQRPDFSDA
jgi:hypothetical protein